MSQDEAQVTANTLRQQAETARILVELGYDKDAAVKAVAAGDLASLTGSDNDSVTPSCEFRGQP